MAGLQQARVCVLASAEAGRLVLATPIWMHASLCHPRTWESAPYKLQQSYQRFMDGPSARPRELSCLPGPPHDLVTKRQHTLFPCGHTGFAGLCKSQQFPTIRQALENLEATDFIKILEAAEPSVLDNEDEAVSFLQSSSTLTAQSGRGLPDGSVLQDQIMHPPHSDLAHMVMRRDPRLART